MDTFDSVLNMKQWPIFIGYYSLFNRKEFQTRAITINPDL